MVTLVRTIRWIAGITFCLSSLGNFEKGNSGIATIIIIIGLLLLPPITKVLFRQREISKAVKPTHQNISMSKPLHQSHQLKINQVHFPERTKAIDWHMKALNKGLSTGDYNLANLSYAKLIESIRQKNENSNGAYLDVFKLVLDDYEKFRIAFGKEYPKQFRPPLQQQNAATSNILLGKEEKGLSKYLEIDKNGITNINSFFKLAGSIDGVSREFWIAEKGEAELLCKILSLYPFTINISNFEILIKKANLFLHEMKNDKMTNYYWNPFPFYDKSKLQESYCCTIKSNVLIILQSLSVSEQLHFFDFASSQHFEKYWDGSCSSRTRNIGIHEQNSVKKMVALNLFIETKDIESVPYITSKGELKELSERKGFELKKSWNLEKTFEFLLTTNEGKYFLNEFVRDRKVLKFNEIYREDIMEIIEQQSRVKVIADLLAML